jgi:Tol biopolymer transport system component
VHPDGSDLKEYAEFANPELDFCWSHDLSKVVLNMQDRRNDRHANNQLQILNLATETTEIIAEGPDAFVDPQCWSPDEKHVVYTINKPGGIQTVRQFDTELRTSEDIANGGRATWSPDGKWIAFLYCPPSLYDCTYFAIDTATNRQKVIFKMDGQTPLQWSPDSRFVTYASVARARERTLSELPREMLRLRVRRIEGGAELPVTDFYDGDMKWFNWVSSPPSALTLR